MTKTAFITGITGQDGAYLARFLLDKGYKVHGLIRWDAVDGTERISDILDQVSLHVGDITDANNINKIIGLIKPDEIYHLAALSHVGVSFETPSSVLDIVTKGSLNIYDAARINNLSGVRIYQASSSEMFGNAPAPQNEDTPMQPCSPYGAAKLAAYHLAKIYRDAYGMFISNGILFNHESPMRGGDFVTKKIAKAVAKIKAGQQDVLMLGNLDARRDWGHASDYVRGMWMMLQHDTPDDFVLASGESYTVRECVKIAFECVGMNIEWQSEGVNEIGVFNGNIVVNVNEEFFRPKEVKHLQGDSSKAKRVLGWEPDVSFKDLIAEMVEAECNMI
jgi:GDPmannose 4,6-dehydratase